MKKMNGKMEDRQDINEPRTYGSLSVVVPIDDMKLILQQMWKSRSTEPKMGELYEKYAKLTTFD